MGSNKYSLMKINRKISPDLKPKVNYITKKRLKENEINFDNNKKIKIGFISCDFINHSVSYNTKPLLENLDRTKFETYAIYLGKSNDINKPTSNITSVFDKWLNSSGLIISSEKSL